MQYRRLGNAGVKVSAIALGSWLTYGNAVDDKTAEACIDKAYNLGINFFDTANAYRRGEAEQVVGQALAKYPRDSNQPSTACWSGTSKRTSFPCASGKASARWYTLPWPKES